jgi:hypothetical protein
LLLVEEATTTPKEDPMGLYPQQADVENNFAPAMDFAGRLVAQLSEQGTLAGPFRDAETLITRSCQEFGRRLVQGFLDTQRMSEVRLARVTGSDLVPRTRAERGRTRLIATTVGRVEFGRIAYRCPTPGVGDLCPADMRMALPEGIYSDNVRQVVARRVAAESLREAGECVSQFTGQQLGIRQLMRITRDAARDVEGFYQHLLSQATNRVAAPGDILVLSADATGVNMIRRDLRERTRGESEREPGVDGHQPPSGQLADRERSGRSRMAMVTTVYDAAPVARTPGQVLPATGEERATAVASPRAQRKQVSASIERSTAEMIAAMFDAAEHRDPLRRRQWVVLVDGARHQLKCVLREAAARKVHVDIIIDIIHVIQYLWDGAADLHQKHNSKAGFVRHYARQLLEGQVGNVIAELRALLENKVASGAKAPGLTRTIAYLDAKRPYLNYRVALAMGWPIATGVIEGACRHIVKDRLAVAGARWSLEGAQAVLLLRTLIANEDFDSYWAYHLDQQFQRVHASKYQDHYSLVA